MTVIRANSRIDQRQSASILCAGGGTAGSVTPLKSLLEWRRRLIPESTSDRIHWVGARPEIEQRYLQTLPIASYQTLHTVKLRRYWDARTVLIPFEMILALFQAWRILGRTQPDVIWTAGSFVAVPIVWIGWAKGIPALTLQQDIGQGLANRLMEPFSTLRASSLPLKAFPIALRRRYHSVGTLVRFFREAPSKKIPAVFKSWDGSPIVLVLGGSSGAHGLNRLLWDALPMLTALHCTIVHSVGLGQLPYVPKQKGYAPLEYIDQELEWLYAHASVVVSRAGMNAISECAAFSLPMILAPLADTHQEQNARWVSGKHSAIVLGKDRRTPDELARWIAEGISGRLKPYGDRLHQLLPSANAQTVAEIIQLVPRP